MPGAGVRPVQATATHPFSREPRNRALTSTAGTGRCARPAARRERQTRSRPVRHTPGVNTPELSAVLDRLVNAWQTQGAPIATALAPGLSSVELDDYERRSGLSLSGELRQWWGWHNGVRGAESGPDAGVDHRLGAGSWDFLSLDEALAERSVMLTVAGEGISGDDELFWRPSWLPVVSANSHLLFVECAGDTGWARPVRQWASVPDDPFAPFAESWTALVRIWGQAIEDGYFTWSREDHEWVSEPNRIPWHVLEVI